MYSYLKKGVSYWANVFLISALLSRYSYKFFFFLNYPTLLLVFAYILLVLISDIDIYALELLNDEMMF